MNPLAASAQIAEGNPEGEWRYWRGDAGSTGYSPLDQINAENFETLQVAWTWRGDNFGPNTTARFNVSPIYVDGILYTIVGTRRDVVAIDPGTGETLWMYREPHTQRYQDSSRKDWGHGVAYGEVDGRGVIYYTSPGYFLHALDAKTGIPLEGFGKPVPVEGFGEWGTVDMLEFNPRAHPYDPYRGSEKSAGYITTTSPPVVSNGVIIVGSALEDGGNATRLENIPGDILAFDARTGAFKWSFQTIPLRGQPGAETWLNNSNEVAGNAAAWAPLSVDHQRGIVYVPTETPTNDYYGGGRPGDNLYGNTLLALDVQTGRRIWHFQTTHHDVWDWDLPWATILTDLTVNGRTIPAAVQLTKQAFVFAFNRETGEPIHPIVETPVPQGNVPGEYYPATQPIPSRPAGFELQGLTIDDLIDFTPELRAQAVEAIKNYKIGPIYTPSVHRDNPDSLTATIFCPSATGGFNITGGAALDPETGILYVSSVRSCTVMSLQPASERDNGAPGRIGETVGGYVRGGASPGQIQGLPYVKPPYGKITAINMNTGEILWYEPVGNTAPNIANNAALAGIDIGNTGRNSHSHPFLTKTLMIYGEGTGGEPRLHAVDKATGERVGTITLPGVSRAVPMSFMHDDRQYIVLPVSGQGLPGSLVALRLPVQGGGGGGGFGGGGGGGGFGGGGPGGPGGGGPGGPGGGGPGGPGGGGPGGPGGGGPGGPGGQGAPAGPGGPGGGAGQGQN